MPETQPTPIIQAAVDTTPKPSTQEPVKAAPKSLIQKLKERPLFILALVIILLVAASAAAVGISLSSRANTGTGQNNTTNSDGTSSDTITSSQGTTSTSSVSSVTSTTSAATTQAFTGQYVSATIPVGWSIVEHVNGAGTDMVTGAGMPGYVYTGLTGLEIKNAQGTQVLAMEAVNGVGGVGCHRLYRFTDTNPAYVTQMQAEDTEVGVETEITDVSQGSYTQYQFFADNVRRVGTTLTYDRADSGANFNPDCGLAGAIRQVPTLSFTLVSVDGQATGDAALHGYQIQIGNTTVAADLLKLDSILPTLQTL